VSAAYLAAELIAAVMNPESIFVTVGYSDISGVVPCSVGLLLALAGIVIFNHRDEVSILKQRTIALVWLSSASMCYWPLHGCKLESIFPNPSPLIGPLVIALINAIPPISSRRVLLIGVTAVSIFAMYGQYDTPAFAVFSILPYVISVMALMCGIVESLALPVTADCRIGLVLMFTIMFIGCAAVVVAIVINHLSFPVEDSLLWFAYLSITGIAASLFCIFK
jgi:hypothetical protein